MHMACLLVAIVVGRAWGGGGKYRLYLEYLELGKLYTQLTSLFLLPFLTGFLRIVVPRTPDINEE